MAVRIRPARDLGEYRAGATCIGAYFNWHPSEEEAGEFARLLPVERMHIALDGPAVVGATGAFPLRLSVPGGTLAAAGVTVVGVQPTHRRQGILSRMMDAQLRDVRERGEPMAVLWASEETIYRRFGYGLASMTYRMRLPRVVAALHGQRGPGVTARLIETDEALKQIPRIYAKGVRRVAGMIDRTPEWWRARNLLDGPRQGRGAGPLQRMLVERDGRPIGYALYRIGQETSGGRWTKQLKVAEAAGVDDAALLEVWRYLLAIDWMDTIEAFRLAVDHPLVLSLTRVNEAALTLFDGLWVRPVDVRAMLEARAYDVPGRVAIEVTSDTHFADNVGVWQVEAGSVKRGRGRPDVRLPVASLGSVFLGGFTFDRLVRSGLAEAASPGGVRKADAMFRVDRAPCCAEIF